MNYYNPYYYMSPSLNTSPGIFNFLSRGSFNFSSILNGAQRVLGLANQALPLIKEAAPMMRNAKTMFKVMNEFKKIDAPVKKEGNITSNTDIIETKSNNTSYNNPTFFA